MTFFSFPSLPFSRPTVRARWTFLLRLELHFTILELQIIEGCRSLCAHQFGFFLTCNLIFSGFVTLLATFPSSLCFFFHVHPFFPFHSLLFKLPSKRRA
ncbi:unnamed protein product [Haemonchus placei]|uniref:Secreted protein n=1 Tax=Haemonchus placei TaxID=6290 RepID=A0A0N4WEC6_HAEPC|nr:unnamed protein product [Haemonchus placei]